MAVYRAKTQAIAHDEPLEYEWFLNGGVAQVLIYNPVNHVLFTLLAKPVVWTMGVSEFKLRAPSLAGTVIYRIAIYFLCKRLFGDGILLFLSIAMLCLNPQILDFMPAARGYILGLAGLAAAMYFLARVAERGKFDPADTGWKWGCSLASISLALSVAASFTNVVPAACLVLTFRPSPWVACVLL
jgi:4-amino-4-deoxy-L-arabinose transferase-like glycosyltransferase